MWGPRSERGGSPPPFNFTPNVPDDGSFYHSDWLFPPTVGQVYYLHGPGYAGATVVITQASDGGGNWIGTVQSIQSAFGPLANMPAAGGSISLPYDLLWST